MSLYRYAGREKLANWLFPCLYLDLVISGLFLLLNFSIAYDYILVHTLETAGIVIAFCFYGAIIDTVRQKIQEYRKGSWIYVAEIVASSYCYLHCMFYILVIGSFLSWMYLRSSGTQISSDFLLSWAIIPATVILGLFYLKYREPGRSYKPEPEKIPAGPRGDYPDGHVSPEDRYPFENTGDTRGGIKNAGYDDDSPPAGPSSYSFGMNCFICGKWDSLSVKGRDGRYYCHDHILPENRIFSGDSEHDTGTSLPKRDTWCRNCRRNIYHKDVIRCGPCGKFFCVHCWESHRWMHGKAPAMGIGYQADGTSSDDDGTESIRR
jgi:hypothetical protein